MKKSISKSIRDLKSYWLEQNPELRIKIIASYFFGMLKVLYSQYPQVGRNKEFSLDDKVNIPQNRWDFIPST